MRRLYLKLGPLSLVLGTVLSAACSSPPSPNKPAPAPTSTPLPPPAVAVEKPVNVSFSTYSKDWPVDWQWIDPDEANVPTPHDVKSKVLRLKVPSGKDLYGENRKAPRYIKAISGDYQIETRVRFDPKENYQGAGLLVFRDDNNYIRFERAYGGLGGGASGLRVDFRKGETFTPLVTTAGLAYEGKSVDLKIVREGRRFSCFWRDDDEGEWRLAGEIDTDYDESVFTGLVACNTAEEVTAEFAYIKLLPAVKRKGKGE